MSSRSTYNPTVTITSNAPARVRPGSAPSDLSHVDRSRAWVVIALIAANTLLPVYDLYLLLSGLR